MKKLLLSATAFLALAVNSADGALVGTELVLAVDVSGSVSTTDFNLQRNGYEAAFRSAAVINAIQQAPTGQVAVTFAYWSSSGQYNQAVGWTVISDSTSANAFADAIAAASRPFSGGTDVAAAINASANLFSGNGFDSGREVIDISGDGSSSATAAANARDSFLNGAPTGVERVINALWIEDPPFFFVGASGNSDPLTFGQNVIGGPGAFQDVASGFSDFSAAIELKIAREVGPPSIATVPEPASLAAWSLLIVGLLAYRRRARS